LTANPSCYNPRLRERTPIPVEVVFNPNWWNRNYGISFDEPFYFDKKQRIENDLRMRRALYECYGIGDASLRDEAIVSRLFRV